MKGLRSVERRLRNLKKASFGKRKWVIIGVGYWRGEGDGYEQAEKEEIEKYFEVNRQNRGRVNLVMLQGRPSGFLNSFNEK